MWQAAASIALVALCGAAVWKDTRERRIPNAIAVAALATGLLVRLPLGWEAVGGGLMAAAIAFGLGFVFFLLGGLGAGDVKLMAGLAAFVGTEGLLLAFVVMAGAGGIMAVVAAVRKGVLGRTLRNLFLIGLTFGKDSFKGWRGEGPGAALTQGGAGAVTNPYAVAIAAGALAGWFLPMLGWTL